MHLLSRPSTAWLHHRYPAPSRKVIQMAQHRTGCTNLPLMRSRLQLVALMRSRIKTCRDSRDPKATYLIRPARRPKIKTIWIYPAARERVSYTGEVMEAALRIPQCSFRQMKRAQKTTPNSHTITKERTDLGESFITSTKERKLRSFMDGYTRKDSSHVTNRVSKGTDAEILDPFDQELSRAEAHAMLDCLLDLNLFIQNV